jgi:hypothetical protein
MWYFICHEPGTITIMPVALCLKINFLRFNCLTSIHVLNRLDQNLCLIKCYDTFAACSRGITSDFGHINDEVKSGQGMGW